MGAAETIAAAIEKLEALRASSTPGPWIAHDMGSEVYTTENNKGWWWVWQKSALPFYGGVFEVDHEDNFGPGAVPIGTASRTDNRDGAQEHADADLIVTLHRTIDAQLAILRETQRWQDLFDQGLIPDTGNADLNLARAILGGDTP